LIVQSLICKTTKKKGKGEEKKNKTTQRNILFSSHFPPDSFTNQKRGEKNVLYKSLNRIQKEGEEEEG
jgi:hypothetical protein